MAARVFIVLIIWLGIDFYFFQAIKTVTANPKIHWAYWIVETVMMAIAFYFFISGKFATANPKMLNIVSGAMMILLIPKLFVAPVMLAEDVFRLVFAGFRWVTHLSSSPKYDDVTFLISRRKFLGYGVIGLAAIPFGGLLYGALKGKYQYTVRRVKLKFKDLPDAFHGFTITQLSDIHAGSFDDETSVKKGIAMANAQKSDVLFFTGDLVNNKADEMLPWKNVFDKLEAPMGKFSILGNHDYGDYIHWENEEDKAKNLQQLKNTHGEIGFKLLLNENLKLEKNGQTISLLGVENWGLRGFHQYGDLNKALNGGAKNDFKILLSHDPSHWEEQVLKHDEHIHLTLSGHTHGMQMGIEIPGFRWSPVQYIYKQWAGAYQKYDRYIYVNRGFGFLGYPGRIGMWPEITVITLEKQQA